MQSPNHHFRGLYWGRKITRSKPTVSKGSSQAWMRVYTMIQQIVKVGCQPKNSKRINLLPEVWRAFQRLQLSPFQFPQACIRCPSSQMSVRSIASPRSLRPGTFRWRGCRSCIRQFTLMTGARCPITSMALTTSPDPAQPCPSTTSQEVPNENWFQTMFTI